MNMHFIATFARKISPIMRLKGRIHHIILVSAMAAALSAGNVRAAGYVPFVSVYVTSWTDDVPDIRYVHCINYAFARVNDTFDGVTLDNEDRLRSIIALKSEKKALKVVLSIGGWGSGGFSEMAADARKRRSFAWDCRRLVWDMGIDGIDIDWEYPTSDEAGITASAEDTENLTLLLKEIRTAIGPKRTLSVATVSSARYVGFRQVNKYVDYYNVMTYDMGLPPSHNAPLYKSQRVQNISVSEAVEMYVQAGVPRDKIVLGIPFYGRGSGDFPEDVKVTDAHLVNNYYYNWDDDAKVPYMADRSGKLIYSYEDTMSLRYKCEYILEQQLRGVMCWPNSGDDEDGTLLKTVSNSLLSGK